MLALQTSFLLIQLALLGWIGFFIYKSIHGRFSAIPDTPFVPTPMRSLHKVYEALEVREGDVVYELGSGDGRFLIFCAKQQPNAQYVGIEHSITLVLISRIYRFLAGVKNVRFERGDFYEIDFTKPTKIYAFLLSSVMEQLLPALEKDFKGRVVSRAFRFAGKKEERVIPLTLRAGLYGEHLLYVYDFKG